MKLMLGQRLRSQIKSRASGPSSMGESGDADGQAKNEAGEVIDGESHG